MLGAEVSRRQSLFVTMTVNVIVAVIMTVTVVARLHEDADA